MPYRQLTLLSKNQYIKTPDKPGKVKILPVPDAQNQLSEKIEGIVTAAQKAVTDFTNWSKKLFNNREENTANNINNAVSPMENNNVVRNSDINMQQGVTSTGGNADKQHG